MKIWASKLTVLVFSAVVYIVGEFLRGEWFVNTKLGIFCHPYFENQKFYCNSPYLDTGFVLMIAAQVFAIIGLILFFADKDGLRRWAKISLVYVPISALIVSSINPNPGGWITFTPSPEHVTWLLGYGYILLTFAIVAGTRYATWRYPDNVSIRGTKA